MKVAVLLRGISYMEKYLHFGFQECTIDFRNCMDNIKTNVLDALHECGHEVDVFVATYDNERLDELRRFYSPAKVHVSSLTESSSQELLFLEGIKMFFDHPKIYDHVIVTRFDLEFYRKVTTHFHFDQKIYFPWIEINGDNLNGDCFIICPYAKLAKLVDAIETAKKRYGNVCLHALCHVLKKKEVGYLFKGSFDSNSDKDVNPLYKIRRHYTTNRTGTAMRILRNIPFVRKEPMWVKF
jgi:hypothetical protein